MLHAACSTEQGGPCDEELLEISKVSATAIHVRNLEIPRLGKGGKIKIIHLLDQHLITAILDESGRTSLYKSRTLGNTLL